MLSFRFKLVAYFSLLVLVPLLAGFFGVRDVVRQSETRRVDAELVAAASRGAGDLPAAIARSPCRRPVRAQRRVPAGARPPRRGALARLLAPHPELTLEAGGIRLGPPAAPAARASRWSPAASGSASSSCRCRLTRRAAADRPRRRSRAGSAARRRAGRGSGRERRHARGALDVPRTSPADVSFAGHRFACSRDAARDRARRAARRWCRAASSTPPCPRLEKRLALGLFGLLILIALAAFLEGRSIVRTVGELAGGRERDRARPPRPARPRARARRARAARHRVQRDGGAARGAPRGGRARSASGSATRRSASARASAPRTTSTSCCA